MPEGKPFFKSLASLALAVFFTSFAAGLVPVQAVYNTLSNPDGGQCTNHVYGHTATLLNDGTVLLVGGIGDDDVYSRDAMRYNPVAKTCSHFTDVMPSARAFHTATKLRDGKVLLVGGRSGASTYLDTAEIYDPADDTFTLVESNVMADTRAWHTASLLPSGDVLIAGGENGSGPLSSADIYRLEENDFMPTAGLYSGIPRSRHGAVVDKSGNMVYLFGGIGTGGVYTLSAEFFDVNLGQFISLPPMPAARAEMASAQLPSGDILLFGGKDGSEDYLNNVDLFQPSLMNFVSPGPSLLARSGGSTATPLPDNKILLVGLYESGDPAVPAELYHFNPGGGYVEAVNLDTDPVIARQYHTATLLNDGRVFIYGGKNGANVVFAAPEVYDPVFNNSGGYDSTDTFSQLSSQLYADVQQPTATLLPTNEVLFTGGIDSGSLPADDAVVLDLDNNNVSSTFPMSSFRIGHQALYVPSWQEVLITGGSSDGTNALISSEKYNLLPPDNDFISGPDLQTARRNHQMVLTNQERKEVPMVFGGIDNTPSVLGSAEKIYKEGVYYYTRDANITDVVYSDPTKPVYVSGRYNQPGSCKYTVTVDIAGQAGLGLRYDVASVGCSDTASDVMALSGENLVGSGSNNYGVKIAFMPPPMTYAVNNSWEIYVDANIGMNTPRQNFAAVPIESKNEVALIGGIDNTPEVLDSVEFYNTKTGVFRAATISAPTGSDKPLGVAGDYYVDGATEGTYTITVSADNGDTVDYSYDSGSGPVSGNADKGFLKTIENGLMIRFLPGETYTGASWGITVNDANKMSTTRKDMMATQLKDGRILIAGGVDNDGDVLSTAEIYDPLDNSFGDTISMSARERGFAGLLPDGKVLIAGGDNGSGPVATAEIFDPDPAVNSFTATGNMNTARANAAGVVTADGRAIVAGGYSGGTPACEDSIEQFFTGFYIHDNVDPNSPLATEVELGGNDGTGGDYFTSAELTFPAAADPVNTGDGSIGSGIDFYEVYYETGGAAGDSCPIYTGSNYVDQITYPGQLKGTSFGLNDVLIPPSLIPGLMIGETYCFAVSAVDYKMHASAPMPMTNYLMFDNEVPTIDLFNLVDGKTAPYYYNDSTFSSTTIGGMASDSTGSGIASVEVQISKIDASGGTNTTYYWSGSEWGVTPVWDSANYTSTWGYDFTGEIADDTYTVKAKATDDAGNFAETAPVTFTYDDIAPTILAAGFTDYDEITLYLSEPIDSDLLYYPGDFDVKVGGNSIVNQETPFTYADGDTEIVISLDFSNTNPGYSITGNGDNAGLFVYSGGVEDLAGNALAGVNWVDVPDLFAPSVITSSASLSGFTSSSKAYLQWFRMNTESDFAGYNVYYRSSGDVDLTMANSSPITVNNAGGLIVYEKSIGGASGTYYAFVTAVDSAGNESDYYPTNGYTLTFGSGSSTPSSGGGGGGGAGPSGPSSGPSANAPSPSANTPTAPTQPMVNSILNSMEQGKIDLTVAAQTAEKLTSVVTKINENTTKIENKITDKADQDIQRSETMEITKEGDKTTINYNETGNDKAQTIVLETKTNEGVMTLNNETTAEQASFTLADTPSTVSPMAATEIASVFKNVDVDNGKAIMTSANGAVRDLSTMPALSLSVGDAIQTAKESQGADGTTNLTNEATLNLGGVGDVTIGNDSRIEITEFNAGSEVGLVSARDGFFFVAEAGNGRKVGVGQALGRVFYRFKKLGQTRDYKVNTPNTIASVRGTSFDVWYDKENDRTVTTVMEGSVEVRDTNTGRTLVADAGDKIINSGGILYTQQAGSDSWLTDNLGKADKYKDFNDMAASWAKNYVAALREFGVVSGDSQNNFNPEGEVTRAQFIKMAFKAFQIVPSSGKDSGFADISSADWYASYIAEAKARGIVQGYEGGDFSPNKPITRAEAAKILAKALGSQTTETNTGFTDVPKAAWYAAYVKFAQNRNLIGGYNNNTFGPGNTLTRAEAAKIIYLKLVEV